MKTRLTIERFLSKISIAENGCWEWTGVLTRKGYGMFWNSGRMGLAHRYSYMFFKGSIPDGLDLDHLCRNPKCVSPDHLEPATRKENVRRGLAPSAMRARHRAKTRCPQGHPYDTRNTRVYRGKRYCRECNNNRRRLKSGS